MTAKMTAATVACSSADGNGPELPYREHLTDGWFFAGAGLAVTAEPVISLSVVEHVRHGGCPPGGQDTLACLDIHNLPTLSIMSVT